MKSLLDESKSEFRLDSFRKIRKRVEEQNL